LSEIIRDINKYSNNVMARQLFLTLGETVRPPSLASVDGMAEMPLSVERGSEALYAWLGRNKLGDAGVVLENGAGLSRTERISARQLAELLQHAAQHPLSVEFQASLPILGVDGSVRNRLRESPAASHAHLKTGTLEGVKSLAGYVRSESGREWVTVFIINHPNAKRGTRAQDALIEWVQQH
jgi:D-alanyl-D-alanine carboxypeptidase/D-alanyl-D-alanine-endopeptidase (penicillin-binding protein 4)